MPICPTDPVKFWERVAQWNSIAKSTVETHVRNGVPVPHNSHPQFSFSDLINMTKPIINTPYTGGISPFGEGNIPHALGYFIDEDLRCPDQMIGAEQLIVILAHQINTYDGNVIVHSNPQLVFFDLDVDAMTDYSLIGAGCHQLVNIFGSDEESACVVEEINLQFALHEF